MAPEISVVCGSMADFEADMYVNSSNGLLLHGSGVAEQLSNYSGRLVGRDELHEYWMLVGMSMEPLKSPLEHIHYVRRREPTVLQYESLKEMVVCRDSRPLKMGDAVLVTAGDILVSNAVGMTYDWAKSPPEVIPATYESVRDSLIKSFGFARRLGCESVAVPVMCTRKGGLSKYVSSEATLSAIESSAGSLKNIFIVLHNDELAGDRKFFEDFYKV